MTHFRINRVIRTTFPLHSHLIRRFLYASTSDSLAYGGKPKQSRLTKKKLVDIIAEEHDLTFSKSARILDTVFDTIIESVAEEKEVKISRFGSFSPCTTKDRNFISGLDGKEYYVRGKKRVLFKPFQSFKDAMN